MNKNYFVVGLYIVGTILVIVIVWQIYRAFTKVGKGINTIADGVHDQKENQNLSQVYGLDTATVDRCRATALKLSNELETNPNMGKWDKIGNLISIDDLEDIWKAVKSGNEARLVANFYQNTYTNKNDLVTDMRELTRSPIFGSVTLKEKNFPYIEAIM